MLTLTCQYCQQNFTADDDDLRQLWCSDACYKAYLTRMESIQSVSRCVVCGKEFEHLGARILCSKECREQYIADYPIEDNDTFWQLMSAALHSDSKVVKKGWGLEVHIVNHNDYCLKYLFFFEGKKFSTHYHEIKQELWHCAYGKFHLLLEHQGQRTETTLNMGEKIEIKQGVIHQLTALTNSVIIEVSTRDFPEDSIRIAKGD
jgi:mannose-6-phosphate isomerase-like protein (cupin superfamily)